MTLSEFQDEIRENIKRNSDGVSDARIKRWVNWAIQYLADLHTYREMRSVYTSLSTTSGDNSLSWPDRLKDLYSVTVQDDARSQKLSYVNARYFDEVVPRPATYSNNIPEWIVDYGSNFELFPIPDDTYSLVMRISQYPEELTDSDDEPSLVRKDALITAIATTFGFYSLREIEDAAYWGEIIVPPLYEASIMSNDNKADWTPIARGFGNTMEVSLSGKWWSNPFTGRLVPGY